VADWREHFDPEEELPPGRYTLAEIVQAYGVTRAQGGGKILLLPQDGPFQIDMPDGDTVLQKSTAQVLCIDTKSTS
jgi:hypothetical protein